MFMDNEDIMLNIFMLVVLIGASITIGVGNG